MCLAIPSRITKIQNNMATIDVEGVQREASLLLLEDARVGDYVIVHAGFAIQKLDEAAAQETLDLLREGGLLAVDNTLWGGDAADPENTQPGTRAIRRFNDMVSDDKRVDISLVPIGDGLTLIRKKVT